MTSDLVEHLGTFAERYVAEARQWIGRETRIRWGAYPVEREPIRRWCHMVKDTNRLYLDEEYAKRGRWGGIICPPPMIPLFAGRHVGSDPELDFSAMTEADEEQVRPATPDWTSLHVGERFEFLRVVRVGDRIGFKRRLVDVYVKGIRSNPAACWVVEDSLFYNQDLDLVAVKRDTAILHPKRR